MKSLKYFTFLLLLSLIIACEKEDESEKYEIDNDVEFYKDYVPDLVIQKNDSVPIDVDNDGSMDVVIMYNISSHRIKCLNDDFSVSIGTFIGSGTGNVDTIAFNEIIDNSPRWHIGFTLFTDKIEYVGLKRAINNSTTYGWIKILIGEEEETTTIEELYFRKEPDTVIRAGIKEY